MTHYRRAPRSLDTALGRLADEVAPETLLGAVQRAWPEAVGEAIAAEARPTAERGGVVTISCSASVWAQELDLMAPQILGRLNGRIDKGSVHRLRCVALGSAESPFA
jgi:predicted nucleic acid-binding Zn ribbon protein